MLNPHAKTPTVVKMNEINPKYENTRKNTPAINQSKSRILIWGVIKHNT